MKTSEILRKLADIVDQNSSDSRPTNSLSHAELEPVEVDHTDNTETSVQIPPLQAKLELMKKSMGMDNAYDDEECGCEEPDELDVIKKSAGIPTIVAVQADDEPLDN